MLLGVKETKRLNSCVRSLKKAHGGRHQHNSKQPRAREQLTSLFYGPYICCYHIFTFLYVDLTYSTCAVVYDKSCVPVLDSGVMVSHMLRYPELWAFKHSCSGFPQVCGSWSIFLCEESGKHGFIQGPISTGAGCLSFSQMTDFLPRQCPLEPALGLGKKCFLYMDMGNQAFLEFNEW